MTDTVAAQSERSLSALLRRCGMPSAAVKEVVQQRPFADDSALLEAVDAAVTGLDDRDLARAVGQVPVQAMDEGDEDTRNATALAMQMYLDRFGYPFISAIPTPSADELLMRVRIRLGNEVEPEGRAARDHLRRIVRARLLEGMQPARPVRD